MSHQKSGRKDQLISGSEWITCGIHFIEQDTREESAPAEALPGIRNRFLF
jgi:hypothetical protein